MGEKCARVCVRERGERRKGTGEHRVCTKKRDHCFRRMLSLFLSTPFLCFSLFFQLLTWSASLSGWPSLTDSEVKRKVSSSAICVFFEGKIS